MLDDFFIRALVAGIGAAAFAAPFGCFVVWRRMAYFGDTIAHSALLGVALAFLLNINITLGVFAIASLVAITMLLLQDRLTLSSDSLLGLLSHSALAVGLVTIAFMTWIRIDLMVYLFGDILAVSVVDIAFIYGFGLLALSILFLIWRSLLADTVSYELAQAENLKPVRARLIFMLLMAAIIALSMKVIGLLLTTALLIIPAATARRFATGPEQMAVVASMIGIIAVVIGLFGSLQFDTPSGPSIVVAALLCFIASIIIGQIMKLSASKMTS